MYQKTELPTLLQLINRLGAGTKRLGLPLFPLTPEGLKAKAARKAGLSDFGSPEFEEGLAVLCRSIERDANMSLFGRIGLGLMMTEALVTRLRQADLAKHRPEVLETSLVPPMIIVGARSGTTFLHRLLCGDPKARPLLLWEVLRPVPPQRGPDRRLQESMWQVALQKRLYPGIAAKHVIDPQQPEEDIFLLSSTFRSAGYYMMAPVYSYAEWLDSQDMTQPYQEYLQHLQLFQRQSPGKRLVLKAPAHLIGMGALLKAIPNALVIHAHRDPSRVLASMNSLIHTMHAGMCDTFDRQVMARANMRFFERMVREGERAFSQWPQSQLIHIRYDTLVKDPLAVVRQIYERFELGWSAALETALARLIRSRPKNRHGRHTYALEDFGLTEREVRRRFARYEATYLNGGEP